MSDIEQGLKEAIAEAQAKALPEHIVRSPQRIYGRTGRDFPDAAYAGARVGDDKRPPLTAPAVIETILELTKQAYAIEALAYELGDALAGGSDSGPSPQSNVSQANMPAMSVFDRMGLALLDLTRTLESIDHNVKRSLGAVKP